MNLEKQVDALMRLCTTDRESDRNLLREELKKMLEFSANYAHPLAIRYPRAGVVLFDGVDEPITLGKWQYLRKTEGKKAKATILAVGERCLIMAMKIWKKFQEQGLDFDVVNARFVKPLDVELLESLTGSAIITLEDNVFLGGFGSMVCGEITKRGIDCKIKNFAYRDEFIRQGGISDLQAEYGVNTKEIEEELKKILL